MTCKQETNLAAVWMRVETAYQKRVLDDRAQELDAVQEFTRTTARNAARVVGGG